MVQLTNLMSEFYVSSKSQVFEDKSHISTDRSQVSRKSQKQRLESTSPTRVSNSTLACQSRNVRERAKSPFDAAFNYCCTWDSGRQCPLRQFELIGQRGSS